jgi:hypothetical protein
MISRWNSFFIFCFVIHALVFAFFPKKHLRDRLPYALITQKLNLDQPASQAESSDQQALLSMLLWQLVSLAEDFSGVEQPNFHLRRNNFYRYSASFIARSLAKLPCLLRIPKAEKPSAEYANHLVLLPEYYSFLFRLTPF